MSTKVFILKAVINTRPSRIPIDFCLMYVVDACQRRDIHNKKVNIILDRI